jgi:ABC-type branched-subunit amino acid transport system permease subunit
MDVLGILSSTASFILDPTTMAYALAGLGLAIHFGFAGLLNMGMAGFMALGAYGYAIGILTFGLPWYLAAFVGIGASIIFALILGIPTLRLRGDYLAIVTIAAAEIIRLFLLTSAFVDVRRVRPAPLPPTVRPQRARCRAREAAIRQVPSVRRTLRRNQ